MPALWVRGPPEAWVHDGDSEPEAAVSMSVVWGLGNERS